MSARPPRRRPSVAQPQLTGAESDGALDGPGAANIPEMAPGGASSANWRIPPAVPYSLDAAAPQPATSYDDPDLPYWLALNCVKGVGPARFRLLLEAFGSARDAWLAQPADLVHAGLDARTVESMVHTRGTVVPEAALARLARLRVGVLLLKDAAYPRLLREAPLPPPVLYVRGRLLPEDEWAVALVGTRRASTYGRHVTASIVSDLVRQRITIVSGLARGIDTTAHTAALDGGGRTIAVLGCGPDLVYPPQNALLAARIVEQGALVTEFPPGTQPDAGNFPARNRLISGLSLGVLVTECPADSGALITARFAGEQGREVFAVPGNITSPSSRGANRLIQDGAQVVMSAHDVLEGLNLNLAPQQIELATALPADPTEAGLLAALAAAGEPVHVDELCRATGMSAAAVSGTLVMLELKGFVQLVGPMTYARTR